MLSFIVPAHNEREKIGACVQSILRFAPPSEGVEVIVVNNRSIDDTGALAAAAGARVLYSSATTIGAVRNEGVRATRGEILVFLDGDCCLTEEWATAFPSVLERVRTSGPCLAGSHPIPPRGEDVFLWRRWFIPVLQQVTTSHIGSAHLICRRDAFEAIGGFDEALETGEDFELCERVRRAGGRILVELPLVVEHHGYPRTWAHFIRRERWHGRGDASSWHAFRRSKVAVLSAVFVLALLTLGAAFALGAWRAVVVAGATALLVLAGAVRARFRGAGLRAQTIAAGIFAVYFVARFLSLVDAVARRHARR